MQPSSRLEQIPPYLFAELERKIADKQAAGIDVISLGIGDPDTPTYAPIVAAAQRAVADPGDPPVPDQPRPPGVPRGGRRLLRPPVRRRARPGHRGDAGDRRQGVHLQPQPRVPRSRTTSRWPPTPAIRSTRAVRCSAGAGRVPMPLVPELGFAPDLDAITADVLRAREADVLQLPQQPDRRDRARRASSSGWSSSAARTTSSPCTTTPTARRPTTGTSRRRSSPPPGAKEIGVEVFSLSKGYNMTGWRCAAIVGNAEAIGHYWRLKSNVDSGLFEAVQLAGVDALSEHDVDADVRAMNDALHPPARPRLRRAGPGGRRRHPAEGHDLHLGAGPAGLRARPPSTASTCSRRRPW